MFRCAGAASLAVPLDWVSALIGSEYTSAFFCNLYSDASSSASFLAVFDGVPGCDSIIERKVLNYKLK